MLPADRFLDREISWLQFNERVLQLAADENVPLLERARFLAIFARNLDEFFMVRVAGLKRRIATGIAVRSASGLEPREVLEQISLVAHELHGDAGRGSSRTQVQPALEAEGITIVRWDELADDEQRPAQRDVHRPQIFPVLTPLAVDPAHPFPYISGLSLNLAVVLVNPATGKEHFARVKVPPLLPRFAARRARAGRVARWPTCTTPGSCRSRTSSPRTSTSCSPAWRCASTTPSGSPATRTSRSRRTTPRTSSGAGEGAAPGAASARRCASRSTTTSTTTCSTCWCASSASPSARSTGCRRRWTCAASTSSPTSTAPTCSYPAFVAAHPPRPRAEVESAKARDIFAAIRKQDVLLHHPYDSFSTSVQAFIEQAAADPQVLAIKQTLYRTSGDSPIVDALIDAAEAGKQVLALVEIKARFDEQANISWARKLEQAGVHVVYGIVGLKTHCKLSLVVRQEAEGLRRYCHIGTGNYNPKTARLYEDLGLLTADPQVGAGPHPPVQPAVRLSRRAAGSSGCSSRPRSVRAGLIDLHRRRDRARAAPAGRPGHIAFKVNSIVDEQLIDALYRASQAGVPVDAVGARHLRAAPGRAGPVREHPGALDPRPLPRALAGLPVRRAAATPVVCIGSADMMHRNLDRRVEALVRLADPGHVAELAVAAGARHDRRRRRTGTSAATAGGCATTSTRTATRCVDLQADLIEMHARRRRKARRR